MNTKQLIYDSVIKFIKDNEIHSEETIYQCDWVIENAYDFIAHLFKLVKNENPNEDDYYDGRGVA